MNELSEERLKEQILHFSAFGRNEDGSISRTFGSEAYREAASELCRYMADCGMTSYIDRVGNVHGIYHADTEPAADHNGRTCHRQAMAKKEILIGSHLDTVKEGGMFDGLLGILAGIACVRQLREDGVTLNQDIHIIATNGEEGNDLGGTFGSRCLTGTFDPSVPGILEKAERFGFHRSDLDKAQMDFDRVTCYLELHIEQGKTLFETKEALGIVTGIVGLQRYEIQIEGVSNHAGTTMMEYRKDALVEASRIILAGDQLARELGQNLVATFSRMEILPNTVAVINHRVTMLLEFRNQDEDLMEYYIARMREQFETDSPLKVRFLPLVRKKPVSCSRAITDAMAEVCDEMGISWRRMPSGATHDGNMFAEKTPIGMIFVPSRDGISHSGMEWTDWEACARGAEALYRTLRKLGGAK